MATPRGTTAKQAKREDYFSIPLAARAAEGDAAVKAAGAYVVIRDSKVFRYYPTKDARGDLSDVSDLKGITDENVMIRRVLHEEQWTDPGIIDFAPQNGELSGRAATEPPSAEHDKQIGGIEETTVVK